MIDKANVRNWIQRAAYALAQTYLPEGHTFGRKSHGTDRTVRPTGAMSSNRAMIATIEYLAYTASEHDTPPPPESKHAEVARDMVVGYYAGERTTYRGTVWNMYTDSLALTALCGVDAPVMRALTIKILDQDSAERLADRQLQLARSLGAELNRYWGGRMSDDSPNEPIITLNVVRSLDAFAASWPARKSEATGQSILDDLVDDERRRRGDRPQRSSAELSILAGRIRTNARESVLRQLGLHSSRDGEFDPGALTASTCLLQRFAGRSARALIVRAVQVLEEIQAPDGSWNADIIAAAERRVIYVSSTEIALLVTALAVSDISSGNWELYPLALSMLERVMTLIESGFIDKGTGDEREGIEAAQGWSNDRTRQSRVVEVWPTALSLQFLLRLEHLLSVAQQREVLAKYRVTLPRGLSEFRWPDMAHMLHPFLSLPGVARQRADRFLGSASDPTDDRKITSGIYEDIVAPVAESYNQRPQRIASFLLFGPPGTRKTSLVRALSASLAWPLVTISPPDFLQGGIEQLESRADQLFADLQRLRRVVVLFDECEELFKRRALIGPSDSRTQGAFITSGMLPRLQELRDARWVVFVIVTNTGLEELDPGIVRPGRLDKRQPVGHPTLGVQKHYLRSSIEANLRRKLAEHEVRQIERFLETADSSVATTRFRVQEHRDRANTLLRDGEYNGYFSELAKVRLIEAEADVVSFAMLDLIARAYGAGSDGVAEIGLSNGTGNAWRVHDRWD